MTILAAASTPLIDWSALWRIALAALIGGAGIVILFGFLLYGVKVANQAKSEGHEGRRIGAYFVSGVCGAICVALVVVGIYAMAHKPKSKPTPPPKSAAVYKPAASRTELVASLP
ncbi:MAG TPA: hypothetical protein VN880_08240 [Solirubrobacteraceae bacterium]|nr:hypothetical protein [Solirubrobacteraceae bacterium]